MSRPVPQRQRLETLEPRLLFSGGVFSYTVTDLDPRPSAPGDEAVGASLLSGQLSDLPPDQFSDRAFEREDLFARRPAVDFDDRATRDVSETGAGTILFTLDDLSALDQQPSVTLLERALYGPGSERLSVALSQGRADAMRLSYSLIEPGGTQTRLGSIAFRGSALKQAGQSGPVFAASWSGSSVRFYVDGNAAATTRGGKPVMDVGRAALDAARRVHAPVQKVGGAALGTTLSFGAALTDGQVKALTRSVADQLNAYNTRNIDDLGGLAALQLTTPAPSLIQAGGTLITELRTGDPTPTVYRESIDLTAVNTLAIGYSDLSFYHSGGAQEFDAFELALVDSNGNTVVPTIGPGRDAFFNITDGVDAAGTQQALPAVLAQGVGHDAAGGVVGVDVSGLTGSYTLVARMIGNDVEAAGPDDYSRVTVSLSSTTTYDVLWGIDEDDATLFGIWDITDPVSTYVDFGQVHFMDNGSEAALGSRLDAIAVDSSGVAYIISNDPVDGMNGPVLLRVDTAALDPAQKVVAEVLGRVPVPDIPDASGEQRGVTGLDFDAQGDLYATYRGVISGPSNLLRIGLSESQGAWTITVEDSVSLEARPSDAILLEPELGAVSAQTKMQAYGDPLANNAGFLQTSSGAHQFDSSLLGPDDYTSLSFTTTHAGAHYFWGRLQAPHSGADSFWVRVDGGAWVAWNGNHTLTEWGWKTVHDTNNGYAQLVYNWAAGTSHTIDIAYRERGTKLDQILITTDSGYDPAAALAITEAEDLAFDANGDAVISDGATDKLFKADPATGGVLGEYDSEVFDRVEGIALNPATGRVIVAEKDQINAVSVAEGAAANGELFHFAFFGATDIEALDFHTTTTPMPQRQTFFLPDEDDGELAAIWNRNHAGTAHSSLGQLMFEVTPNNFVPLAGVEPAVIDTDGVAYFVHTGDIGDPAAYTGAKLFKLDLTQAADDAVQVVTYVGNIPVPATGDTVPGLTLHPTTGELFGVISAGNNDTDIDTLIQIDKADASIITTIGPITNASGDKATHAQAIAFNANGTELYVSDIHDDNIYVVNPTTANITGVYDNDPFNGVTPVSGRRINALALDTVTDDLLGTDQEGDDLLDLNPTGAANIILAKLPAGSPPSVTGSEGLARFPHRPPSGTGTGAALAPPALTGPENPIPDNPPGPRYSVVDPATLDDVTASFDLDYLHTSANEQTGEHLVGLRITKQTDRDARDQLLLVIDDPDVMGVEMIDADGVLPISVGGVAGRQYIDIRHLLQQDGDGYFVTGSQTAEFTLRFRYTDGGASDFAQRDRFDFGLSLLGNLNRGPAFVEPIVHLDLRLPLTGTTASLTHTAVATDPDGDALVYSLLMPDGTTADTLSFDYDTQSVAINPITGELTWTANDQAGLKAHAVTIVAADYGGLSDYQTLSVNIFQDTTNRPPQFTSDPIRFAKVGEPYAYQATAVDPDNDTLFFVGSQPVTAKPQKYTIPVGQYFTGEVDHLTFINDLSVSTTHYQQIKIYEQGDAEAPVIALDPNLLVGYGEALATAPTVNAEGDTLQFVLAADFAYPLGQTYTVTPDTVLEFFYSRDIAGGSVRAIGLDSGANTQTADRVFKIDGTNQNTPYIEDFGGQYDGSWGSDAAIDFSQLALGGPVTWTPPASVAGARIDITLSAYDLRGGSDSQTYSIYVLGEHAEDPVKPDLELSRVFTNNLTYDGQLLTVSGTARVGINNLGGEILDPFSVVFFEDLDFDQAYTDGVDTYLGEAEYDRVVDPGEYITLAAPISGHVTFSGAPIHAMVDAGFVIDESDETNNVGRNEPDYDLFQITEGWSRRYDEIDGTTITDTRSPIHPDWFYVGGTPVVADLNQDGTPDVVAMTVNESAYEFVEGGFLRAFDGATGADLWAETADAYQTSTLTPGAPKYPVIHTAYAIGDILKNDGGAGYLEIAAVVQGVGLVIFDHEGNIENQGTAVFLPDSGHLRLPLGLLGDGLNGGSVQIIDLDGDGEVDIAAGHAAFDASGNTLWDMPAVGFAPGRGANHLSELSAPIFADINLDGRMNAIYGTYAYNVDDLIADYAANGPSAFSPQEISGWTPPTVGDDADLVFPVTANLDGDDEAELVYLYNDTLFIEGPQELRLRVLNHDGSELWSTVSLGDYDLVSPGTYGSILPAPPVVADIDGDGVDEIAVSLHDRLIIVGGNDSGQGEVLYTYLFPGYDPSKYQSNGAGASSFDFDGDGLAEIVSIGRNELEIIGLRQTGQGMGLVNLISAFPLPMDESNTGRVPVIADIDADGSAEILLSQWDGYTDYLAPRSTGGLWVFDQVDELWAPTRQIWNQLPYSVTNIHDDGTLPELREPSWLAGHNLFTNPTTGPAGTLGDVAELTASHVRVEDVSGNGRYTVQIGNGGLLDSVTTATIELYADDPSGGGLTPIGVATVGSLAPGAYTDVVINTAVAPDETVWIKVDSTNAVLEADEDNNLYHAEFVILPGEHAPNVGSAAVGGAAEGASYVYQVVAGDPDGLAAVDPYELAVAPDGMTIDKMTGLTTWTPGAAQGGRHPVQVVVTDATGDRSVQVFWVEVAETVNTAPTIATGSLSLTFAPGAPMPGLNGTGMPQRITATDPEESALFFELIDAREGMSIDKRSGVLSWTAPLDQTADDLNDNPVLVRVTDGKGGSDVQSLVFTAEAYTPPQIDSAVALMPATEGTAWTDTITLIASPEPTEAARYRLLAGPAGMEVSRETGALSWSSPTIGEHEVVVEVYDRRGVRSTARWVLRAEAATLTTPGPDIDTTAGREAVRPGQTYFLRVEASHPEGRAITGYSLDVNAPDGMAIADPSTGLVSWTPGPEDLTEVPAGQTEVPHSFTVTATDADNQTRSKTFSVFVRNETVNAPPVIDSPAVGAAVRAEQPFTHQFTATDADADDVVWILVSGPDGAAINPDTGLLTWWPEAEQSGSHLFTVAARDAYGGLAEQTFTLGVVPGELAPRLSFTPVPRAVLGTTDFAFKVTVTDSDTPAPILQLLSGPSWLSMVQLNPNEWVVLATSGVTGTAGTNETITLRASDDSGLVDEQQISVRIESAATVVPPMFESVTRTPSAFNEQGATGAVRFGGPEGDDSVGYTWTIDLNDGFSGAVTATAVATNPSPERFLEQGSLPEQLTIAPVSGSPGTYELAWTPSAAQAGSDYIITLEADQTGGPSASHTFIARVRGHNTAPQFQPLDPIMVYQGGSLEQRIPVADAEGDALRYELKLSAADANNPGANNQSADPEKLAGLSLGSDGVLRWTPDNSVVHRTYTFNVVVTDPFGAESSQSIDVIVGADTEAPSVSLTASRDNSLYDSTTSTSLTVYEGDTISFIVDATDNATVENRWVELSVPGQSDPIILAADDQGMVWYTPDRDAGSGDITITAIGHADDPSGNEGNSSQSPLTITLKKASDAPPVVSLASPTKVDASGATIPLSLLSEPFNVQGYVVDGTLGAGGLYWKLELIDNRIGEVIDLVDGSTGELVPFVSGTAEVYAGNAATPGASGLGATIDPRRLANGSYTIRLVATDNGEAELMNRHSAAEVRLLVSNQIGASAAPKLGNFELGFTDLSLPVAGLPMEVVRNYDSLDADKQGDFGYGWSLDLITGSIDTDSALSDNDPRRDLGYQSALRATGTITIDLPGGEQLRYRPQPQLYSDGSPTSNFAGALLAGGAGIYTVAFLPVGQNALGHKLEFTGGRKLQLQDPELYGLDPNDTHEINTTTVLLDEVSGEFRSVNAGADSELGLPLDPITFGMDYRLTTRDGSVYEFDSATGKMLSYTSPTGATMIQVGDDVVARNVGGAEVGRLVIGRDGEDRITSIGIAGQPAVTYGYSEAGDLAWVKDRTGRITTMQYGDSSIPGDLPDHILKSVTTYADPALIGVDPTTLTPGQGTQVITTRFNADGELTQIQDAAGQSADFAYMLNASPFGLNNGETIETVTDATGTLGVTAEIVRDQFGNVLRRIQQLSENGDTYLIEVFEYDSTGQNQTAAWQPFEHTDSAGSRFTAAPLQQASGTTYNSDGVPTEVRNADGDIITRYLYEGPNPTLPTTIIDALGNPTHNAYDRLGRLTSSTDADGNTTEYAYNRFGDLTKLVQVERLPNGQSRMIQTAGFTYDNKGRLIATTAVDPDANGSLEPVTRYFGYDAQGNQTHAWSVWTNPNDALDQKTNVSVTGYDSEGRTTSSSQFTLAGEYVHEQDSDFESLKAALASAAADRSTTTEYDGVGRVFKTTDRFGSASYTLYDSRGNVVETRSQTATANVWRVSRTVFDDNGRAAAASDPFLLIYNTAPDEAGFDPALGDTVAPDGSTAASDDHLRSTRTVLDGLGRTTTTQRLAGANAVITIAPDPNAPGHFKTDTAYTGAGDTPTPASVLSELLTVYDGKGRVDYTVSATGVVTESFYDLEGRQFKTIINPTLLKDSTPNPHHDPTIASDITTTTTFDLAGRTEATTDPLGRVTSYAYDTLGRSTATTQHGDTTTGSATTRTVYDDLGRRVAEVDALGRRTDYEHDDAGRLTAVVLPEIDPTGSATGEVDRTRPRYGYEYDRYGNRISITDPNGHITLFEYDAFNRMVKRTLPEGVLTTNDATDYVASMTYYQAGEANGHFGLMKSRTDEVGRTTSYTYDAWGRINTTTYTDGGTTRTLQHGYDLFGREYVVIDTHHGVTVRSYDAEGRLTQELTPEGILNHAYDDFGRKTRTWTSADPAGQNKRTETSYTYDALDRLKTTSSSWRNSIDIPDETTTYHYDANGNLDAVEQTNGVTTDYQYDALNRLTDLYHFIDLDQSLTFNAEPVFASFIYTLDQAGNRIASTEVVNGATYSYDWVYDGLNRLVQESLVAPSLDDYTHTFAYDEASNRIEKQIDSANNVLDETILYSHDANDRITSEDSTLNTNDTTYVYNDAGDQTSKTTNGNTTNFNFDVMGRMVGVDTNNDQIDDTTYVYNARGERIGQTDVATSTTTIYLIDASNPTGYAKQFEEHTNGSLTRSFTLGLMVHGQWDSTDGAVILLHDGHGSTRLLMDAATATVLETYAYTAFGDALGFSAATAGTQWLFANDGVYDPLSGLTYHLRRYRDGHVFISRDPFAGFFESPLSLHKRIYAHGNPVMLNDANGLFVGGVVELLVTNTAGLVRKAVDVGARLGPGLNVARQTVAFVTPAIRLQRLLVLTAGGTAGLGLGSYATDLVTDLVSTLASYRNAIDAAANATSRYTRQQIEQFPVFFVQRQRYQAIWAFRRDSLTATPRWHILNRHGFGKAFSDAQRLDAQLDFTGVITPTNNSIDEFPYASTLEGGLDADTRAVPFWQNRREGRDLGNFYQHRLIPTGRPTFLVVPVPFK